MFFKPRHARYPRRTSILVVWIASGCVVVALAAGVTFGLVGHHGGDTAAVGTTITVGPTASAGPSAGSARASASPTQGVYPVSIDIPAIHVDTTLEQLTLDSAGALNPPTDLTQAGWYTGSSVPGTTGPAVIAGHVDSYKGPAVFFYLKDLAPGDTVDIALSDGSKVTYHVTAVSQYSKDAFPTQAVYGARPDPELRLITCGGDFANGHYLDNVVVYATLTGPPV